VRGDFLSGGAGGMVRRGRYGTASAPAAGAESLTFMASNPHLFEQLVVVGATSLATIAVVWHWLAWRLGARDLLAPFRFRTVGRVAEVVGLLGLLTNLALVASGTFLEHRVGWMAWGMALVSIAVGFALRRRYESATVDALELARDRSPFERTQVYAAYIEAYPESDAAIDELLSDSMGLQTIVQLDQRGVRFQGRPLLDEAAARVEAAGAGAVSRALELGHFARRADLVEQLEKARFAAGERNWEAIIRRAEGMPRVGEQVRRLLEDITVYPDVTVELSLLGAERADRTGRMAINTFEQALRDHFAQVHVPMRRTHAWYETSAPAPRTAREGTPPWELQLELIAFRAHPLVWEETTLVRERVNRGMGRMLHNPGVMRVDELLSVRTQKRQAFYPMLRMRCTLRRNGKVLDVVEADSSSGLSQVEGGATSRRGIAPVRQAATVLLRSMVKGLAMHIEPVAKPAPAVSAAPPVEDVELAEAAAEVEAIVQEEAHERSS